VGVNMDTRTRVHVLLGILFALAFAIPVITGEYKHFYVVAPLALIVIVVNYIVTEKKGKRPN
jgi:hypothetical protein